MSHGALLGQPVPLMLWMGALALVPFAAVMVTSFTKMAVVLSLSRSALGTQQAPPTLVLTGLAAALSWLVMAPVLSEMQQATESASLRLATPADIVRGAKAASEPLRDFLIRNSSPDERSRFLGLAQGRGAPEGTPTPTERDAAVAIPAFLVSQLQDAFRIGFLVFLPFLVLDMVVANVLLALGMQTLSPSQVSLPFKILLFVAVDGWGLMAQGLILGYR